jgi:protein phosphatase
LSKSFHRLLNLIFDLSELESAVRNSVDLANKAVRKQNLGGGGTTLTMVIRAENQALVANVGDSRTYLMRSGRLTQVTTDHSLVERLVSAGQITREEAENHPQKNIITRSLNGDKVEVDIFTFDSKKGEQVL